MAEVNSQGMQLRVKVVTLGCGVMHLVSCSPRTEVLSPSAGLWYPGGETIHCLTMKRGCDPIHM